MAPHDPDLVPEDAADLFYHGKPAEDGTPRGLEDEQYDEQKAAMIAAGTWPFPAPGYTPPA